MKKKKIVATIVLCVCVLLVTVACSSKGVTESSAPGSASADSTFSGKVVIMPTMCEGMLLSKKQAKQLMDLIDPEASSGERLIYEATKGHYANNNSELFGATLYWCDDRSSNEFQFEWNGAEIYDYSLEDWSDINNIDLSKSDMELVGEYPDTPYGGFSLYRRPQE